MRKCFMITTGLVLLLCVLRPLGHPGPAFASSLIVNTTDDSTFDGICNATHCTLREAITLANSPTGSDYIHIVIPDDDPGCDGIVCTITLGTTFGALPPLQDMSYGTVVDGTSQPDTNPDGPDVVINGSGSYNCFDIWSNYNTIKGFVINECVVGVTINGTRPTCDARYNTISGNYIGVNYDGTTAAGNTQGGILLLDAHDNTIGGTTPQERNIISGNGFYGVDISGADAHHNVIIGNYIGTGADGTGAIANGRRGIAIGYGAHNNTVGGLTSGEGNVISGNNSGGVEIDNGANNNGVTGNFIGTAANGFDALPNLVGVFIGSGAHHNVIGFFMGNVNTIAHNTAYGVRVDGSTTHANTIIANSIHSNGDGGIALTNDANNKISPPQMLTALCTWASGTAPVGYTVQLFSDYEDEGRQFQGADVADGSGEWTVLLPSGIFSYPNLTATATDTNGNTSEFSAPKRNGCEFVWMPLGMKRY